MFEPHRISQGTSQPHYCRQRKTVWGVWLWLTCHSELFQVWNMAAIEAQFMLSVGLIGKCYFLFRSFPPFMFMVVKANRRLGLSGCHMTPLWPRQANLQGIASITVEYNLVAGLRYLFEQLCGLLRERCERRHAVGVVLPLCELGPEAGSAQKVLPDPGRPRLSHLCVRSVLSNLVLHHNSWGPGTHRTKQGTALHRRSPSTCRQHAARTAFHSCV